MRDLLPCLEIETGDNPVASIIWLHGLGADGHDFEPIIADLGLPKNKAVRFIFPHAPSLPVTINGGYVMPAWYDIKTDNIEGRQDEQGILASAQAIQDLITREKERGVLAEHMILAGFSQGGAMALYVGIRQQASLAGILGLSCYTLLPHAMESIHSAPCPIMLGHGESDDIVALTLGEASRQYLLTAGFAVDWQTYDMAHSLCPQQIKHIGAWLNTCLKL
ncbi:MAG: dienelactone hydrolase family protein [Ghiorsea sp.]